MLHAVVVGAGLAGLTAALQASRLAQSLNITLQITILEKCARPGGNSMRASSGINALTPSQHDTPEVYKQDTLASGGGLSHPELVDALVGNSAAALDFLTSLGLDLSKVSRLGGHSKPRCHSNPAGPNVGYAITSAVLKAVQDLPNVSILPNTEVIRILTSDGRVVGVEGKTAGEATAESTTAKLDCGAVILATGGFAANKTLLQEVSPEAAECATTNGPWATGDGIRLGKAVGAQLVDMEQVQVHPTGFVDPADPDASSKILAAERLRGVGGLLLDASGRRFVDELQRRDHVTAAMRKLPGKKAWLLLGSAAAKDFGGAIGFYCAKGLVKKVQGGDELAAAMGVEEAVLRQELEVYNQACAAGGVDAFGKTVFPGPVDLAGEMYVGQVTPVVHYTMGGVGINECAEVLSAEGACPIPGLYAAGEVAGGLHGANRLGGNSLLECVVFGRISADSAVRYLAATQQPTAAANLAVCKLPEPCHQQQRQMQGGGLSEQRPAPAL